MPQDADRVCEMSAAVSLHEGAVPPKFDAETFLRFGFGPDRAFACFVAEGATGLMGHVSITWGFDVQDGCRTIWVADLFVEAAHRRNGIGRALMAHVCKEALAKGAGYVQFMMAQTNKVAADFYAKVGARQDGGVVMFLPHRTIRQIAEHSR